MSKPAKTEPVPGRVTFRGKDGDLCVSYPRAADFYVSQRPHEDWLDQDFLEFAYTNISDAGVYKSPRVVGPRDDDEDFKVDYTRSYNYEKRCGFLEIIVD